MDKTVKVIDEITESMWDDKLKIKKGSKGDVLRLSLPKVAFTPLVYSILGKSTNITSNSNKIYSKTNKSTNSFTNSSTSSFTKGEQIVRKSIESGHVRKITIGNMDVLVSSEYFFNKLTNLADKFINYTEDNPKTNSKEAKKIDTKIENNIINKNNINTNTNTKIDIDIDINNKENMKLEKNQIKKSFQSLELLLKKFPTLSQFTYLQILENLPPNLKKFSMQICEIFVRCGVFILGGNVNLETVSMSTVALYKLSLPGLGSFLRIHLTAKKWLIKILTINTNNKNGNAKKTSTKKDSIGKNYDLVAEKYLSNRWLNSISIAKNHCAGLSFNYLIQLSISFGWIEVVYERTGVFYKLTGKY